MERRVELEPEYSATSVTEFNDEINEKLISATVTTLAGDPFSINVRTAVVGDYVIQTFSGTAHTIRRGIAEVEADPRDLIFIQLVIGGTANYYSEHHSEIAHPGEAIVYHPGVPSSFSLSHGIRTITVGVPPAPGGSALTLFQARLLSPAHLERAGITTREVSALFTDFSEGRYGGAVPLATRLAAVAHEVSRPLRSDYTALAVTFVERRFTDPDLGAEDVAAAVGLSTRQLNRLLGREDRTISSLILEARMGLARHLLVEGQTTIAEIGRRCGFNSDVAFSRAFAKAHGTSPSGYRARTAIG